MLKRRSRRVSRVLMIAPLALVSLAAVSIQDDKPADEGPWRILVTNDDGIESPGLSALVAALAEIGEVYVAAPAENCSGSSASSDGFGRPLGLAEHSIEGAQRACAIAGKPVDACQFGVFVLGRDSESGKPPFDLVVSGINRGANVGELSHYSGTVGAAVAAAHQGLPAIAVSQDHSAADPAFAAGFARRFASELLQRGARPGVIYSINVPGAAADDVLGVRIASMGGAEFGVSGYAEGVDAKGESICRAQIHRNARAPEGSDTAAYVGRYVTITPLQFDWTDRESVSELQGWGLSVE